jgi:hypothetical protein
MTIALQPIYTQTLTNTANASYFNNIPQTFTDLKVVFSVRVSLTTADQAIYLQLNGDGNTVYSQTTIRGDGSSASSYRLSAGNAILVNDVPNGLNTASTYSNLEFYIPNYTSSNFKQVLIDGVKESNSASTAIQTYMKAALWRNTAAVTSLNFGTNISAPNFENYSTVSLYGITKG